ncbi:uncharacterized protein LOC141905324 [Tubulanus polymorphus]|uniref:uncharacterized protein LOC141905324 n=1 Tax=Tubulanus polymorphus TaxID=672921 RepID=UPI003DA5D239
MKPFFSAVESFGCKDGRVVEIANIYVNHSVKTQCKFPSFAQSPKLKGRHALWITQREYFGNGVLYWRRQVSVTVRNNVLIYHTHERHCTENIPACQKIYHSFNRTCIKDHGRNRFLVEHSALGRPRTFQCIQLLRRGPNAIQIRESSKSNEMRDSLCRDDKLIPNEWPWLAEKQRAWNFCPQSGGFVFYTFSYATQMGICPGEWRQSRLEVECMDGEGLEFSFPSAACNPFSPLTNQRLYCFANWVEDGYTFVIIYEENSFPRFTMRYPSDVSGDFNVYLYQGIIVTLALNGRPAMVNPMPYYKMRMKSASSSLCSDESEQCKDFSKKGFCTSKPPYEYARFCKEACGNCPIDESSFKPECKFPKPYHGSWMLYEQDRTEVVRIHEKFLEFSKFGKFSCKNKDFAQHRYKLMTTLKNGCRPRYTCIEFNKAHHNVLQYRISPSKKSDLSFNRLCHFKNDPIPLDDGIRSRQMKNLILKKGLRRTACHINGLVPFNASFSSSVGPRYCPGHMSDYDVVKCERGSRLSVQVNTCQTPSLGRRETFTCIGRIAPEIPNEDIFLFTRNNADQTINCWIINKSQGKRFSWDGRIVYRMSTSQCNTDTAGEIGYFKQAETTYLLHDVSAIVDDDDDDDDDIVT